MAKDTEKLIRQLSLISYLMAERRPVTATEIRRDVEGYSDMTEDAFARRFYADRAELDSLGIHLSVDRPADGFSEQENYSLAPEAFFLPAVEFTDAELAALQTALSLLDGEFAYAEPLRLALQQLTWGRPSPLGSPAQRAIGVEAPREGVLRHVRVSLDVAADLRRRHRTPLSHQIRDQGELPDELFCVLRHRTSNLRATTEPPATPSLLARGLCAELEPYMPLSLVLIEDHQALREGLELLLSREGLEVVGTAGSAGEGRELVERHSPDVALVDIRLGEDSGIDLTRDLLDADPERRVVLYTGSNEIELLISGLDSGARGYALKEGTPSELTAALNTVAEGGTYVDPRLRPALLSRRATQRMPSLSKREREIMDLLAQGLTGEQVAEKLVLSSETVKTHIRNAMAKLEASTRVHAIAIARREGYIQPPSSDGNYA